MNSNHWQRIEELFHAASQLAAADRTVFLDKECSGDEALRGQVESLLAALDDETGFMEQPALTFGMRVISGAQKESLVGRSVGRYKVVRLLGEGGMGEVYLAEDVTLERHVALKFLAPGLVDDVWAREQLMNEARAVARLENPNICAVYGLEEIDGHNFIVMQYVEGETLASLLSKGRLKLETALELAEQIAGALAAAHSRGIVHRDIKPQNIMVTAEGQAKVLDFGLAKLVHRSQNIGPGDRLDQTSQKGLLLGTVAYMSPEQAQGQELDCGSDIFSFGIVLHQMFAGKNPFVRETREDTIDAITTEESLPLPSGLPTELVRIGEKCLQKNQQSRYEGAGQLLVDLRRLRKSRERATIMGWRRHLQYYAVTALALLLLVFAAAGYAYKRATKIHKLAIAPILNHSGEPDKNYLSKGMTRNLFDKFSYLPRLRVKLPTVPDGKDADLLQMGRDLSVEAVLSGEIVRQEGKLLLRMRMINSTDGKPSWEQTFDLDPADMLTLQDEITRRVASEIDLWLIGSEQKLLSKRQTDNSDALRLYMKGRVYWDNRTAEKILEAIAAFDQAVDLDPAFAKAYTGRADCYVVMTTVAYGPIPIKEAIDRARWNANKALEIDESLPEAHTSMGLIKLKFDWDWPRAEQEFRRAIELDPEYAPAHFWYSNLLPVLGRFDEAIKEGEVAKSLDPYSPLNAVNYGRAFYYARRYDTAATYFKKMVELYPTSPQARHMLGLVLLQQKDYDGAIRVLQELNSMNPRHAAASLGFAYGKAGRSEEALKILSAEKYPNGEPVLPLEKAIMYVGLGDLDKAFSSLEEAYRQQSPGMAYLTIEPIWDDLRGDSRFIDLTRRLDLTVWPAGR